MTSREIEAPTISRDYKGYLTLHPADFPAGTWFRCTPEVIVGFVDDHNRLLDRITEKEAS